MSEIKDKLREKADQIEALEEKVKTLTRAMDAIDGIPDEPGGYVEEREDYNSLRISSVSASSRISCEIVRCELHAFEISFSSLWDRGNNEFKQLTFNILRSDIRKLFQEELNKTKAELENLETKGRFWNLFGAK